MSKNRIRFYIILVIVCIAFSAIAFLAPFNRNDIFWLSYAFGIVAILLQAYSWPKAFANKNARSKFYGFPIARITTIYMIAQLVLSLAFMGYSQSVARWVVTLIFILLLAIAAIGLIAADTARDEVERQEVVKKADTSMMKKLRARAEACAASCTNPELQRQIQMLAEDFRFSDPVSNSASEDAEAELLILLKDLSAACEGKDEKVIQKILQRTKAKLDERNMLCRTGK